MDDTDIIFGAHSIAEAIKNPQRGEFKLFCTEDSLKDLRKIHFFSKNLPQNVEVKMLSPHALQEKSKLLLKERQFKEQRASSNIFLLTNALESLPISDLYKFVEEKSECKILALDQVTDVHNIAAILRTAAFYNLDYVLISRKGDLNLPPNFFKIASGGFEHVKLLTCSNLSKTLNKLIELGVECVGLAEEAEENTIDQTSKKKCLVMGAEDVGLSNAVRRILGKTLALKAKGQIKSLNVSVAAALSMEKFF